VKELGLEEYVVCDGIIEPSRLRERLEPAHIGIVAYQVSEITNTTISNKLFHYMGAGVAVLSTDMRPTRRVVEQTGCGWLIPRNATSADVARMILEFKAHPSECIAKGERGRQAIQQRYNWQQDFGRALACLERLTERRAPRIASSGLCNGHKESSS
jgi:glycosyltransferase involved in cell wall biosynthesis